MAQVATAVAAAPAPAQVHPPTQQELPVDPSKVELTENQKKLLGMTNVDDPSASLEQQVDITLKGKEQRMMLMQKLMQRKQASPIVILRNMVGPEDVDEDLQIEITGQDTEDYSLESSFIIKSF